MSDNDKMIGTWRLVSALLKRSNGGEVLKILGENPSGLLTYTGDGRMTAILSADGRKPLSVPDPIAAPAAERAEAFATFVAYAGTYTFDGDTAVHRVEVSSIQNWVGTDQIRFATFRDSRLILATPPVAIGGEQSTVELVWERLDLAKP